MTTATKTRNLKLMADYDCYPLWERSEAGANNVNPADLSISRGLQDALDAWALRYDDTLDRDDPRQSGFHDPVAEVAFKADGEALLKRLQAELGQSYRLIFQA